MKFKNIEELQAHLMPQLEYATELMRDSVKFEIDNKVHSFYQEYSPKKYSRTDQLRDNWEITNPQKYDLGYKAKVFFNKNITYYKDDVETVLQMTMHGSHGGINIEDPTYIWDESIEYLNNNIKQIAKDSLRDSGIEVK